MPTRQIQRVCRLCRRPTLHAKQTFSGALGCFFTLITAGLFLPFWLLADVFGIFRPYRCQVCGTARHVSLTHYLVLLAIILAWAMGLYYLVKSWGL